ncbi:TPA: hypothetical protein ACH3X1_006739 [Trebouxia sp. C0004]
MARFASAAELESFLRNLEPDYAQYASALWQHQVRTANQLANASKSLLLSWGLLELHVDDIKARANSAGRNSTEDEAGPSKKPRTGHISETPLTEQSELLVDQYLFKPLPDSFLPSTGSQVLQWLFDFTEMKVPVTPLFYQQMLTLQGPQQCLIPVLVAASAVTTFTDLLQTAPRLPFNSEQNTTVYVCGFIERCWQTLATYSPTNLQYDLMFNKISQLSTVSSHAIAHKLRPDTMLVVENCTLMLGEDKHIDLAAAYADLSRKRVDLSGMHYGPVKFMLGYAAAGTTVQWCFLPDHADQVET